MPMTESPRPAAAQEQRDVNLVTHLLDDLNLHCTDHVPDADCEGCRLQVEQHLVGDGQTRRDLADWLRDSLRTRLLFGCYDEPLDEAGCRVVRAILDRLDRR
jgi:hypothetical protein